MTWLLPSALGIAAAASVALIALHFITRARPQAEAFPTARFIPDRPVRARTRSYAMSDVPLLLLRIAAVLALGVAVAGPIPVSARGRVARVFVIDRSHNVGDVAGARDSVRRLARPGDVVLAFDTIATLVASVDSLTLTRAPGSLSTALAVSIAAGRRLSAQGDSVELVVVSPLRAEEVDSATWRLRAQWPGGIRVVRAPAAALPAFVARGIVRGDDDDPVVAALAVAGHRGGDGSTRVTRTAPTQTDSAWARSAGHVLVHWPATDAPGWTRRARADTIAAVSATGITVVAEFPRHWTLTGAAVARWSDGEVAATERATGDGCIRDVAVIVDGIGDLSLRPAFRRFAGTMLEPCGGTRTTARLDSASVAALAGGRSLTGAVSLRANDMRASPYTPWLLALGAALLIAELAARRAQRSAA